MGNQNRWILAVLRTLFQRARTTSIKLQTLAVLRTLFGCLKCGVHRTANLGSSTDTFLWNDRTAGPRQFYGHFSTGREINHRKTADLGSSTDTFRLSGKCVRRTAGPQQFCGSPIELRTLAVLWTHLIFGSVEANIQQCALCLCVCLCLSKCLCLCVCICLCPKAQIMWIVIKLLLDGSNCCSVAPIVTQRLQLLVSGVQPLVDACLVAGQLTTATTGRVPVELGGGSL